MGQSLSKRKKEKKVAFVKGDRIVVNETAYWGAGRHGVVVAVNDPDNMTPGRPIATQLDDNPGGNTFYTEDMLDYEMPVE
jgi:hypothetical protein